MDKDQSFGSFLKGGISYLLSGEWLKATKFRSVGYMEFIDLFQNHRISAIHAEYQGGPTIHHKANILFDNTLGFLYDSELTQKRQSLYFGIPGHPNPLKRIFAIDTNVMRQLGHLPSEDHAYMYLARNAQIVTSAKKYAVTNDGEILNVVWEPKLFRTNILHKQEIAQIRAALTLDV